MLPASFASNLAILADENPTRSLAYKEMFNIKLLYLTLIYNTSYTYHESKKHIIAPFSGQLFFYIEDSIPQIKLKYPPT